MRTYIITGATGNTGKPITLGLLEAGHKVRIISRNAENAKELMGKGAELFLGDGSDPELLKRAFTGADAVYAMIPFNYAAKDYLAFQIGHVNALTEAMKESEIQYVVSLSSVGAHLTKGAGVVEGLYRMETAFDAINGLNTMHLRAAYFMENILAQIGAIKHMGVMASPVKGDMPIAMVATRDIAALALDFLLALDFKDKNHQYVLGPKDVTYHEVAKTLGSVIGIPDLKYHTVSYDDGAAAMIQMGMGESVTHRLMEFVRSLNEGRVMEHAERNETNTTPTSIQDFAQIFKTIFN